MDEHDQCPQKSLNAKMTTEKMAEQERGEGIGLLEPLITDEEALGLGKMELFVQVSLILFICC